VTYKPAAQAREFVWLDVHGIDSLLRFPSLALRAGMGFPRLRCGLVWDSLAGATGWYRVFPCLRWGLVLGSQIIQVFSILPFRRIEYYSLQLLHCIDASFASALRPDFSTRDSGLL